MRRSRTSRVVLVGTLLLVVASMILGTFSSSRARAAYYAGQLDTTFTPSTTAANTVDVLSDGSVLVGQSSNVVKYTSAGASTGVTAAYGGTLGTVKVISGDKFYVGGGNSSKRVARYNSDGTQDTAFTSTTATGRVYNQDCIVVGTDGSVYVAGGTNPYFYKFSSTGVRDTNFDTAIVAAPLGNDARAIALQSDGKILVGVSNGSLKRYNSDGTLDATLVSSGLGTIYSIVQLGDGSIATASTTSPYLRKYSSTGTLDTSFASAVLSSPLSSTAQVVRLDSSGRLVVGGNFSGYVKRFSATGTPDTSFNTQAAASGLASVSSLAIQSNGNILVAYSGGVKRLLGSNVAPNTPSAPTAVAGDGQATVTVTQPSGAVPTYYTVTAVEAPDKFCTVTGSSGSCIVSGLTNGSPYTFTATASSSDATSSASSASSSVTPIGVPPVFGSAAIDAAGTTLILTYNKALGSTTAPTTNFTVIAGGAPVTVTSVTVSGSTVRLALGEVVIQGQVVTVSYNAPASSDASSNEAVQDALGLDAASLSTTSVTNGSLVDKTAPVYASVANTAAGTTITLTYNESLSTTTALASAFTVNNGSDPISVSSVVTTSGTKTVVLTLASPVGQGKTVTVIYTAPAVDATTANSAIQDAAGNDAPSFSALTLGINSSTVDQTGPVFSSATVSTTGLTLTLNYNETLQDPRAPASAFTVLVNGSPVTVSSVAASGNTTSVVLTMGAVIGSGKTVTVAYTAPTADNATTNAAIQDLIGNDAASLTARSITNNSTVDQTGPVFSSATVSTTGLTLTLNYNETLRDPRAPASAFTVLVNGSPVTVSSVAASGNTTSVVLTLASPIGSGKAVTIAYEAPTVDTSTTNTAIQDTTGNDAASLTATSVTNSSSVDQTGPTISTAVLASNGTTLTLTYNETLKSTTATTADFVVTVDGSPVTVSSVTAPGTNATVVLTLASAVSNDKTITVAYTAPAPNSASTNPAVQDTTGNDADSFTARSVTNNSTVDTTRPTISTATVTSSGTEVNVLFSENVSCNIAATSDFGVQVNGVPVTISSGFNLSCSNNAVFNKTLTLRLSGVTITSNQTVTVSYTAPQDNSSTTNAAMQDTTGNDMLSVSGVAAINSSSVAPDLRAPIFTSATANTTGTLLTLTYDEALISTTAPASAYTVTIDGVAFQPSAVAISGTTVQLTMGTAIQLGKTVTVSYTAPTTDSSASNAAVQDSSGNDSVSLVNASVSNFSTAGPDVTSPTLSNVTASGTTVTLTFNENLRSITAGTDKYTVFVGNDAVTVSGAVVSGSTVVLTLASAIPSGELVSVSYTAPTSSTSTSNAAVQDYEGNDAASFSGNNRTTSTAWSWLGTPEQNTSCTGSLYAGSSRQRSLPNGVTYSVAVSGPYVCMYETSESLSDRGGNTSNFSRTGLITDPGVFLLSREPLTTSGDTSCTLHTIGTTLSKCLNRGEVTMTFSEPTLNPVISFAGWGGTDGDVSWSELELVTPGVSLTMLSGTNIQVIDGTYVGVVNPRPGTRCYNSIPAGCGSLQVNGTVTEVKFKLNYNANGAGWGNDDAWNMIASVVEDFGQLPVGYDTPAASHVVGSLMLGSVVTADNLNVLYGTTNADAVTNGTAIPATEDGVSSLGALGIENAGSTYSLPVSFSGVAREARLCGWIDFNRNGAMSLAERTCATNPATGATSATLNWTVPSDIVAGLTYARIRLSYDAVPLPTSKVSSGEVEDYSITIASSAVPNAVNDTSTNAQDINQVISPLANDNFEAGYPADNSTLFLCGYGSGAYTCDKISLTVPGEGVYTVNSNGTVTFDPLPSYVGTATPVQYQISDTQSRPSTATITPTVTPSPTASADTTRDYVNVTQSKDVLTNDTAGVGILSPSTAKLCSAGQSSPSCTATTVSVTGGVYTLNTTTGVITFTPTTDWVGTAPAVSYQVADGSGQFTSSAYTPTVVSQPIATNDTSSAGYDVTQTISPLLNDTPGGSPLVASTLKLCGIDDPTTSGTNEIESPNNCTKTSLTIPGEGTYTVNSDGTVTFDPLPTFYGSATPRTYQISDALGETTSANIIPTVGTPPLPTAQANTSSGAYDTNQTLSPLEGDTAGSSSFPFQVASIKLCGLADNTVTPAIPSETPNSCSQTTVIVPGEGTYTLNTTTGVVTFDPLSNFTGQVQTPITYQVKDSLDRYVNSNLTPTVSPPPVPTATADALTSGYDANQTYTPTSNDTAGATDFPMVATSVKLCGIANSSATPPVVAETPNNCTKTSLTVPGEGTYTVNGDGSVTFDPLPTFTGQVQTPVKYQAKDSLDRYVNSTITPTVGPPPVPAALADAITDVYDTNQTYSPTSNDTAGTPDFPMVATSVKLCGIANSSATPPVAAETPNTCSKTSLTVPGEGTYTVNPDGTVTFDPLPSFTGQVQTPVVYQAKDSLDRYVHTTITPTVGPPPVPTALADAITDAYDTNQTYTPLGNDSAGATDFPLLVTSVKLCGLANSSATPPVAAETPNTCSKTSLIVPGEGTYTVNSDGTVTFDPLSSFTGTAQTPVRYQANDSLDRYVNTTITPTVNNPPGPVAVPNTSSGDYNANQTINPLANDSPSSPSFPLDATSVKLCGLADNTVTPAVPAETPNGCSKTTVTVPGEGTYTLDTTTGVVTFDPLPSFTGQVQTPVKYQVKDSLDRYVNSTITPTVGPPPVPTASPDAITDVYDLNQTYTPLDNDAAGTSDFPLNATSVKLCGLANSSATPPVAAETPNTCSKTSLIVPGEGTYTVNSDGTVTFNPLPSFTGQAQTPVTYQANDSLNRSISQTITPTVGPPPVPTASPDAITDTYDKNQVYTPVTNDTKGAADFPIVATTVKLCGANDPATPSVDESVPPNCNATSLTVTGEGTYTVNPDGSLTFDPLSTFTGTVVTVAKYQATDTLGRVVNSTITPTVTPPAITVVDDAKTGPYDTNQVIAVLTNDTPAAQWDPLSVKLCGLADSSATPPVAAETPNTCSKTSLTVPGEGTYTVNADGTVTFDPLPSFTGQAQTPVTYQVTDVLGRTADANITPTVDPPTAPVATPETKLVLPGASVVFTNTTGTAGLATGTGLVTTGPNATCLFTPGTTTCESDNSVEITGVGTYVLDPATGVVTFTALSSAMSGNQPSITYRVTDITGQTATSTLTPIIPAPPAATDDVSSGPYDTNQAISPLTNDSFISLALVSKATLRLCGIDDPATTGIDEAETPNSCSKTSLVVPGEGTFTVNTTTGVVTFDPLPTFVGTAAPVGYQVADVLGRYVDATITPTVSAPGAPNATPETKLVLPGATITFTPITGTSGLASGSMLATTGPNATCLFTPGTTTCESDNSITVIGEGTWTLDPATGVVTFTASSEIMPGTKTSVTYRVTDVAGQTATNILTPIVPPPPVATNDTSSGPYDTNQTVSPLANDSFSSLSPAVISTIKLCGVNPAQKPNDCDKTVVVVPDEGTYTRNANGTVTFDPLPTFVGTATPLGYQVQDTVGRYVNATITPTVAAPPVPAATLDTGMAKQGKTVVLTPWTNDSAGTVPSDPAVKVSLVPTSIRLCPISTVISADVISTAQSNPTCTLTKVTTVDGTYTVDTKTGKVTFVHKKGFVGTVTQPVTYQIANNWDGVTTPQVTTSQLIPTIIGKIANSVSVGDKVWRDLNGNGRQGVADIGIVGVKVTLLKMNGKPVKDLFGKTVKPLITDKNGKYLFTDLPAGQYKVVVTYPPNFRSTFPNRGSRETDSSTYQAFSKVLALGQSDLSLGFGMVPKMTSGLARTL
jgi:uncharacterized repeat protein (TIGR02059 family)/uncharacterized delta-60 repeat protein